MINLGTFPTRGSIWALPTKLGPAGDQFGHLAHGPAGDQSGHFPTKLGSAGDQSGDQSGHFPYQTGTSKESIWALPPPNWDQQGINLGASPTKMGLAGDQSEHFPHQLPPKLGPAEDLGTSTTKLGSRGVPAGDQFGHFPHQGINLATSPNKKSS